MPPPTERVGDGVRNGSDGFRPLLSLCFGDGFRPLLALYGSDGFRPLLALGFGDAVKAEVGQRGLTSQ
jgi:hypothetical protein